MNEVQKLHRTRIFNRLNQYVSESKNDPDVLWDKIVRDYDVFCASQIKNVYGQPFIPAPWQSEWAASVAAGIKNEFFSFACRRSGKSSGVATITLWLCALNPYTIVQIYAPTEGQLFIINYITDNLNQNSFLREVLVCKPHRHNLLKRWVKFINGSEIDTWSMGKGFSGDSARGGGGNLLIIEEIGLWKRGDLDAVIKPMKREAYSDKRVFYIGTPTLEYNPDLPQEWEKAQLLSNYWTKALTCWEALRQGIRTPQMMIDTFFDYGIPCDIVRSSGLCPKYLPEMFEDLPADWTCPLNEVCMENDNFVREELIAFPKMSGALFTRALVSKAFYDTFGFEASPNAHDRRLFIMAADSALLMDYTQILVGEMFLKICEDGTRRPAVRVIYWREVSPEEIMGSDPYPIVDAYKTTHKIFDPKWILADASTTGGVINHLASIGEFSIPKSKWVSNRTEEQQTAIDIKGLVWSGEFKDEMFKNLKNQLIFGTIELPFVQPFASKMMEELTGLEAKPIITGRYSQIVSRKGKKKDLASALAMLAWALVDKGLVAHTYTISVSQHIERAPIGREQNVLRQRYGPDPFTYPKDRKGAITMRVGKTGGLGISKGRRKR